MQKAQLHLVLVDDSRTDRELFHHHLMHQVLAAYSLHEERSGEGALLYCQTHQPDCIVLDYQLPDMDGLDLLAQLRQIPHMRFVPILLLTGSGSEAVAVATLKSGAQDYLVKGTFTAHALEKTIHQAVHVMHVQQELERKQQELVRQHQSFRMVAENAPDIIARFDQQGRHLYVNPAVTAVTDMSAEQFLGKTNAELGMPTELVRAWEEALAHVFATQKEYGIDFAFPADGSGEHFQSNMVPEYDADGQIVSVLAITRNITRQKEDDKRKDTFIGVISHELRAPLASIKGNLQLAERRLKRLHPLLSAESPVEAERVLSEAEAFIQRSLRQVTIQNRLIQDLLDVSRLQSRQLELSIAEYDIGAIVEEVVINQQVSFPTRVITLDVPQETLIWAMVDRDRIQQVLTNYVVNALKYSDKQVTVGMTIEQHAVCVWVKDSGPGLSQDMQMHIWDRFYQGPRTQATRTGLGLGLSICKTLVEMHEGQVGVESTPGSGALFWFRIPFHHAEAINLRHK